MGLPLWKRLLFTVAGLSFDRMAKKYGGSYPFIFVQSDGEQLAEVAHVAEERRIKPSVDTVFPFDDVNAALDKVANGRSRGKTVIRF